MSNRSAGERSCPALWNVLHDAIIVGLNGRVPGTVQLELECDYLRERIDHPGDRFFITLSECTRLAYRPSVDDTIVDNLELLALRRLWITRVDAEPGFCRVHCTEHIPNGGGGTLEISAAGTDLRLEGGKAGGRSRFWNWNTSPTSTGPSGNWNRRGREDYTVNSEL